jgi:hypothetical protein
LLRHEVGVTRHISLATCDEFFERSLVGFREGPNQTLDRLGHDSPLRFGLKLAERVEFQLHIRGNPNAELRIIRHPLAGNSAGRWPSAAAARSSITASHVLN